MSGCWERGGSYRDVCDGSVHENDGAAHGCAKDLQKGGKRGEDWDERPCEMVDGDGRQCERVGNSVGEHRNSGKQNIIQLNCAAQQLFLPLIQQRHYALVHNLSHTKQLRTENRYQNTACCDAPHLEIWRRHKQKRALRPGLTEVHARLREADDVCQCQYDDGVLVWLERFDYGGDPSRLVRVNEGHTVISARA